MGIHHDITAALQTAARRRHRQTLVRKEAQSGHLGARGYHDLRKELNETEFLPPVDADTTKANIYYIRKRFESYCDKGLIMTFLRWICETYLQPRRRPAKKKTINQYWRDFKMLYRRCNKGRVVNANDCQEIRKYVDGTLKEQFYLDDQPKNKPVMGVDDLLLGLTHHWSRDRSIFPTEDDRLDLSAIMLFQAYTACRPAELVDGTKSRAGRDPMLDDPEVEDGVPSKSNPTRELQLTPGVDGEASTRITRRRLVPARFAEGRWEDDDSDSDSGPESAYDSDSADATPGHASDDDSDITGSGDDTSDTEYSGDELDDGKAKECRKPELDSAICEPNEDEEPARKHKALCYEDIVLWIVRDPNKAGETSWRWRSSSDITKVQTRNPSRWIKSGTDPMKYSAYAFYLDRIGSDLGSEEKWTSYCLRRGNANALLTVAPNPVVDQVMRHDPLTGCLANAYLNHRVGFNTQDAFLERNPSADGLTRAFTHMSIRCNPEVPKEIPKSELDKLEPDPTVVDLTMQVKRMAIQIRQEHGFIKYAPKEVKQPYDQLRRNLKNAVKAFREDMTKVFQNEYRRRMHNAELERQLSGMAIEDHTEPSIQHRLEERTQLQALLCDFDTNMSLKDITDRKVRAIDLMVRLASRREVRLPRLSPPPCESDGKRATSPDAEPVPKPEEIPWFWERRSASTVLEMRSYLMWTACVPSIVCHT
ncbi:hypothetical protein ACCO45_012303 [Purpureocillium lilacinum]|uniref:Uncharacterized protein n=1 Tax=Purpureocillium lilacinum TaxID=33203 RepID=A0ACC4D7S3_PURLI